MVGEGVAGEQDAADDLYAVAPEQFVAARDSMVRQLRSEGRREEAAVVAKRRRPPPTAWALNQVARRDPALIDRLLASGRQLREAMDDAVRGDASGVKQAQASEREAVSSIVSAAVEALRAGGRTATDAVTRRLAGTLRAAVVDEEVAGQLRRGTLDTDREAPGLGLPGVAPGPPLPPGRARPAVDREDDARRRAARTRRAGLEAEAERLDRRAWRLEEAARDAESRARQARADADQARADANEALQRAGAAEEE